LEVILKKDVTCTNIYLKCWGKPRGLHSGWPFSVWSYESGTSRYGTRVVSDVPEYNRTVLWDISVSKAPGGRFRFPVGAWISLHHSVQLTLGPSQKPSYVMAKRGGGGFHPS